MVDGRRAEGSQARALWPLPGGAGNYLGALRRFLDLAEDEPHVDEFTSRVVRKNKTVSSAKAARSYLHVVIDLGFLAMKRGSVVRTQEGEKFVSSNDFNIVRQALVERVAGVSDLLDELRRQPDRIGLLLPRMQALGYRWQTASQIRYRLRWLEEVGMVKKEGRARPVYSLASVGAPRLRKATYKASSGTN